MQSISRYECIKYWTSFKNVKVIGAVGKGKSTLIANILSKLDLKIPAPEIGNQETTKEPTAYRVKQNMFLWDMPGLGGKLLKKWIYPILLSRRLFKFNILFRTDSFWKARRLEAIFGRLWESLTTKHENKMERLGSYHKFWFRTAHLKSIVVNHIKLQRTGHFDFTFLVVNANEGINQMELFFLRHLVFNKRWNIEKCYT